MSEFLIPDKIIKCEIGATVFEIKQKLIPDSARASKYICSYVKKGQKIKPCAKLGKDGKALGICVHNTAEIKVPDGTDEAEQYCRATYPNLNMGGGVVHFFVCKDSIWQQLSLTEQGWHATDGTTRRKAHREGEYIGGNLDTISIECIGDSGEAEENTALLCAYLCKTLSLNPKFDIYSHNYFYAKKYCPCYILPHWDKFIERVKTIMEQKDYENSWAKDYIEKCIEKGYMKGYPDGSFKPDNAVTRAELATVLVRIFGEGNAE